MGDPEWVKTYGSHEIDYISDIHSLRDGYIATAVSRSFGDPLLLTGVIMKLDEEGELLWSKRIGTADYNDRLNFIIADEDQ